jgi:protein-S-isoprenylcysteine O-methyltransferase Ste14
MQQKMTHFGVGPKIMLPAFVYAILAGIATYYFPKIFLLRSIPYYILISAGIILLIIGIPMLLIAARAMFRAFDRGELVTTGAFGLVRNPIYCAWIFFILPALALFCRSWPMLLTSLVAYIIFKMLIKREEQYLEEKFGKAYLDYRSRVNEIIPIPKFRRK